MVVAEVGVSVVVAMSTVGLKVSGSVGLIVELYIPRRQVRIQHSTGDNPMSSGSEV